MRRIYLMYQCQIIAIERYEFLFEVAIFMCYSDIRFVTKDFRQCKRPKNITNREDRTFFVQNALNFCVVWKRFIFSSRSFKMPDEICAFIIYCDTEMLSRMFSIEFLLCLAL